MAKAQAEIRSLARAHTAQALKVLAGIMNQQKAPPAARVSAAQAILDRGHGKPSQAVQHSGAVALVTVTPEQLAKLNADELAALEAAYPVLQKLGLVGGDTGAAAETGD